MWREMCGENLRGPIPRCGTEQNAFLYDRSYRKKFMPARIATQRGNPQYPTQHRQGALHMFRRNLLQAQVAANPAARIAHIAQRHRAGMEAPGASLAPERSHSTERQNIIPRRTAARTAAIL